MPRRIAARKSPTRPARVATAPGLPAGFQKIGIGIGVAGGRHRGARKRRHIGNLGPQTEAAEQQNEQYRLHGRLGADDATLVTGRAVAGFLGGLF